MGRSLIVHYPASAGDILAAVPAAGLALYEGGFVRINWICKAATRELFRFLDSRIVPVTIEELSALKGETFDCAIDLTGSARGRARLALVDAGLYLSPSRHVDIGRGKGGRHKRRPSLASYLHWRPRCQKVKVVPMPADPHIADRLRKFMGSALGIGVSDCVLVPSVADGLGWRPTAKSTPRVSIYHGASAPTKIWPDSHTFDLAKLITADTVCEPIIVTSHSDRHVSRALRKSSTIQVDSWESHARWIRSSDAVIGFDTGPVHLAATMGAPTIGLFGPTPATRCGLRGARAKSIDATTCVFRRSLRPCWHRIPTWRVHRLRWNPFTGPRFLLSCHSRQCLEDIKPSTVLAELLTWFPSWRRHR